MLAGALEYLEETREARLSEADPAMLAAVVFWHVEAQMLVALAEQLGG